MNEKILNLHTLSRKYCMNKKEEYKGLIDKYRELELGWNDELEIDFLLAKSSEEILDVILREIESINLKDLKKIKKVIEKILSIGKNAQIREGSRNMYKSMNLNINKEKQQFCTFIKSLKDEDLSHVEPLFYRKVLSENEIFKLFKTIGKLEENLDEIWLKYEKITKIINSSDIIKTLCKHNVTRVYELSRSTKFYTSYEMDVCVFNPFDKAYGEWYWFSDNADWMIYFDHEGYCYIYGKWFIEELGLNSL